MYIGINIGLPLLTEPKQTSTLQKLQAFGGMTFYKDYANNQTNANADYSVGVGTVTVTASRSGTFPATYYNSSGGLLVLTTANVPRWTAGYYDSSGFHLKPGLMVEGGGGQTTGRNNIIQSEAFTDVAWVATTITVADGVADGVLTATVSTLSASAPSSKIIQAVVDAVAGKYTASVFIKRKTGTGTISLRANTADTATDITAFVGTSWTRVQVTSSSAVNPTFELDIATSGDEVYVFGAQLEKFPWMTSYIPSTTTNKVRATESVKYAITGNRTVAQETLFVKFTPLGSAFVNDSVQRTFLDTDTKARIFMKNNTGAAIRMIPNNTDNSTVLASGTTTPAVNTSCVVAGSMRDASPNADLYSYVRAYTNGVKEGSYTTAAYTDNAWGTNFYVGSSSAASNNFNGIIETVAIYSTWQDDPSVNAISEILSPPTVTQRSYLFLPTTTSSSNVVSGTAGTVGNQVPNPTNYYLWMDTYACSDVGWVGGTNRTGETWRGFFREGSDSEDLPGAVAPVGDIVMRTYTKSTNTMTDPPATIYTDATYGAAEILAYRNPAESFIRVYFTRFTRAGYTNSGVYCIKSDDLTCATWGSPTLMINADTAQPWDIVQHTDGRYFLFLGNDNTNGSGHCAIYSSTNLDTWALYSTIPGTTGSHPEGGVASRGDGTLLAIMRFNAGNYLLQASSADWGLTWTAVTSTGLGASTGAKVKPRIRSAAGNPDRVQIWFYDRGDNRGKFGTPTKFTDAVAGTWLPTYLAATSNQGNGGLEVIDDTLLRYIPSTQTGTEPTNEFRWWIFKDLYTWVAQ